VFGVWYLLVEVIVLFICVGSCLARGIRCIFRLLPHVPRSRALKSWEEVVEKSGQVKKEREREIER